MNDLMDGFLIVQNEWVFYVELFQDLIIFEV